MIYIVSYDLSNSGQRYDELISKIKESPAWARLGGSAYLVESDKSATDLRNNYKSCLDENDKIYVGRVSAPAAWSGMPHDVSDWIISKLRENG